MFIKYVTINKNRYKWYNQSWCSIGDFACDLQPPFSFRYAVVFRIGFEEMTLKQLAGKFNAGP